MRPTVGRPHPGEHLPSYVDELAGALLLEARQAVRAVMTPCVGQDYPAIATGVRQLRGQGRSFRRASRRRSPALTACVRVFEPGTRMPPVAESGGILATSSARADAIRSHGGRVEVPRSRANPTPDAAPRGVPPTADLQLGVAADDPRAVRREDPLDLGPSPTRRSKARLPAEWIAQRLPGQRFRASSSMSEHDRSPARIGTPSQFSPGGIGHEYSGLYAQDGL